MNIGFSGSDQDTCDGIPGCHPGQSWHVGAEQIMAGGFRASGLRGLGALYGFWGSGFWKF